MAALSTFLRKTSGELLQSLFEYMDITLPDDLDWAGPEPALNKSILAAIADLDEQPRALLTHTIDRVAGMSDDAGDLALQGVVTDREGLAVQSGSHDRALWTFLNHEVEFHRAEQVRFTDEYRRSKRWNGFTTLKHLDVKSDEAAQASFKLALSTGFAGGKVHVDIFDRKRPMFDGRNCDLVQITVYTEGPATIALEFEQDGIVRKSRRPVFEASMTYEPATGVVEVVAKSEQARSDLFRHFARELLATDVEGQALPRRRFDLSILKSPCKFPTDAEDGIEAVHVRMLRMMPIDDQSERITLETTSRSNRTIWDMAESRFGANTPLRVDWSVTMAKLVVRFHPARPSGRGKTMPLTITMPAGCDLKDQTEREQLIGEKYLRRWKLLVEDVVLIEE